MRDRSGEQGTQPGVVWLRRVVFVAALAAVLALIVVLVGAAGRDVLASARSTPDHPAAATAGSPQPWPRRAAAQLLEPRALVLRHPNTCV